MGWEASSWPWLYEQMYMQDDGSWPTTGDVNVSSSLISPDASVNSQPTPPFTVAGSSGTMIPTSADAVSLHDSGGQFAQHMEETLLQPQQSSDANSPHRLHSVPTDDAPQPSRNVYAGPHQGDVQCENTLRGIVQESIEYASQQQFAPWNVKQASARIHDLFDIRIFPVQSHMLLEHLVGLYFDNFYLLWPLLHRQTLQSLDRDCPYFLLTLAAIGAAFAGESAWVFHTMLLKALRERLTAACFLDSLPEHQLEYLTGSLMLIRVSFMYFGHSRALSSTQMIGGALIFLVRRIDLLGTAALSGQRPMDATHRRGSMAWLQSENRKHLAAGALMLENDVSLLFGTRPLLSAEEVGVSIPCPTEQWADVGDPGSIFDLNPVREDGAELEQPAFSQLILYALDMSEPLPPLSRFEIEMIIHGLQIHVWRHSYEYALSIEQAKVHRDNALSSRASALSSRASALSSRASALSSHGLNTDPELTRTEQPDALSPESTHSSLRFTNHYEYTRDILGLALNRLHQALFTGEQADCQRSNLLAAQLLFHLDFMKLHAPISAIHRLFLDTSQDNANAFTLRLVSRWANKSDAAEAAHHALALRELIRVELSLPKARRARFNVLAQFGLFHGAAVIWALAGARGDAGPSVHDPMSGSSICVDQSTVLRLLRSSTELLYTIGLEWNGISSLKSTVRDMAKVKFPRSERVQVEREYI